MLRSRYGRGGHLHGNLAGRCLAIGSVNYTQHIKLPKSDRQPISLRDVEQGDPGEQTCTARRMAQTVLQARHHKLAGSQDAAGGTLLQRIEAELAS